MDESEGPVSTDDLSPSLGGERASAAPEPEAEATAGDSSPFGDEFANLFGAQAGAEIDSLVQTFGLFGATLQSLVTETMQVIETRLPETLAAFEGLLDAVGQALDEPLSHQGTTPQETPTTVSEETSEVQDQDV